MRRFARFYGANPLHLLTMMFCFALWLYVIVVAGPKTFINTAVWWQSIAVWFVGAAVLHDLLLFPLYALADLSLRTGLRAMRGLPIPLRARVPIVNYVRLPVLGTSLTFVMFFPGIIKQGTFFYHNATGLTQDPFLRRWLLLVAAMFATSALAYAVRLALRARRRPGATSRVVSPDGPGPSTAPAQVSATTRRGVWPRRALGRSASPEETVNRCISVVLDRSVAEVSEDGGLVEHGPGDLLGGTGVEDPAAT